MGSHKPQRAADGIDPLLLLWGGGLSKDVSKQQAQWHLQLKQDVLESMLNETAVKRLLLSFLRGLLLWCT